MPFGPGKYDQDAQQLADRFGKSVILLVVENGNADVAVKVTPEELILLPSALRALADQLDKDVARQ